MKNKILQMPKFLKPDFSSFNFEFEGEKNSLKNEAFKQELLLVHGKRNTLILLDGKAIYNSLPTDIYVSFSRLHRFVAEYKKKQTDDFVLSMNKQNLNSSLVLISKSKGKKQKINLVFGVTSEVYHFSYIELEKESNLEIFEKVVGRDNAKINHSLIVETKDNSNLNYMCFQDVDSEKSQVFTHNLFTCRDSVVNFEYLNLSKANTINLSYGNLMGQGSSLSVGSCSFASGETVFKNLMLLHHKAKHTFSNIENVAVVNDSASYEIDGIGRIDQSFIKSDAQQESKIISLKDTACIVANPQLIINEFDVKAGHAAGIGGLDQEQIYYLQSRGLTKAKAKELLILALSQKYISFLSAPQKQEALNIIRKRVK